MGLAVSVFFAIKDAIMAARGDNGEFGVFQLESPATPERIRMACTDRFTQSVLVSQSGIGETFKSHRYSISADLVAALVPLCFNAEVFFT